MLTYQNRPWHEPGERPFRFTLSEPMPPALAAQFAERVSKPVRDNEPISEASAFEEIPAVGSHKGIGVSNQQLTASDFGLAIGDTTVARVRFHVGTACRAERFLPKPRSRSRDPRSPATSDGTQTENGHGRY